MNGKASEKLYPSMKHFPWSTKREWVRAFTVDDPRRDDSGKYTVYRVTSVLFPVGFPEASTKIVVYKRFSDFKKLEKDLKSYYARIFPLGVSEFPSLPKARFLGRFNESVIEERRDKSLHLLEFAAQIPQLYNSNVFTSFMMIDGRSEFNEDSSSSSDEAKIRLIAEYERSNDLMDASAVSVSLMSAADARLLTPEMPPSSVEESIQFAQACQKKGELAESVNHYKDAIEKLLVRAKSEKERDPIASKRLGKKASEYLAIAESLNKKRDLGKKQSSISRTQSASVKMPHLELFGDIRDLSRYKVNHIIGGNNIAATDVRRNEKVVIKTLQKSTLVFKSGKTSLLPININFMVKLLCYYETEDFIHLILENVPLGKIYDLVEYLFASSLSELESKKSSVKGSEVSTMGVMDLTEDAATNKQSFRDSLVSSNKSGAENVSPSIKRESVEALNGHSGVANGVGGPDSLSENYENILDCQDDLAKNKLSKLKIVEPFNEPCAFTALYDIFPGTIQKNCLIPMILLQKWFSQLCQVLFGLHARGILIKDLNPSNLLLDPFGNLKLTYQCEWVSVDKTLSSEAIDGGYVAPEISYIEPITPTCDWWSVGVLLYELSSGVRFSEAYPSSLLPHTPVQFPNQIAHMLDPSLISFVEGLLQPLPHLRLGAGSAGADTIRGHSFFNGLSWEPFYNAKDE